MPLDQDDVTQQNQAQDQDTLIDIDTSDAVEMEAVDEGEYKLQVVNVEFRSGTSEKGNDWRALSMTLDIPDQIEADYINHFEFLPNPNEQDPKRRNRQLNAHDRFKRAFGFGPSESLTPASLEGREAWAFLRVEDDPEYGRQNRVARWIPAQ